MGVLAFILKILLCLLCGEQAVVGGHKNILLRSYNEKYMNAVTEVGPGQTWKGCMLVISFETQCKLYPLLSFPPVLWVLRTGN